MGGHGPWWRGAILLVSFVLLALAAYRLADDYRAYRQAVGLKEEQVEELERLDAERDAARTMLENLHTDPLTREQLVRSMGYVKPGEQVYVLVPAERAAGGPSAEK